MAAGVRSPESGVRSPWVKWTLFPLRAAAVDHMSVSVGVCVGMSGRACGCVCVNVSEQMSVIMAGLQRFELRLLCDQLIHSPSSPRTALQT